MTKKINIRSYPSRQPPRRRKYNFGCVHKGRREKGKMKGKNDRLREGISGKEREEECV